MIGKLAKQLAGISVGSMVLADGTTKKAAPAPIIAPAAGREELNGGVSYYLCMMQKRPVLLVGPR
jgi:hypothetical protein